MFNGMYLLLETLLLPDALDIPGLEIWPRDVRGMLGREAQRFWFFALVCAACAGTIRLKHLYEAVKGKEEGAGGEDEKRKEEKEMERRREKARPIVRRLIADVLDLAVPGNVVGWVPLKAGPVGVCMLGSTILTCWEVWDRCGREVDAANGAGAR